MCSLVPDIRNCHGRSIGELPLDRKVPGIDRREDVRIAANLRIVSDANRNHATGRNRRKYKRGWPDGKIERSRVRAAIGQVLVDQDGKILGQHMSENRSEDSDVEAPAIARPNDRLVIQLVGNSERGASVFQVLDTFIAVLNGP